MLIPSIDLMDGRVVQLQQGERLALSSADLDGWIAILERLMAMDLQTVVPGHGPVSTLNEVTQFRDLLAALRSAVAQAIAAGTSEDAAATEVASVEADMAVLHARVHEQVYSVLTPDQQTQLKALKDQRAAMRAQRRAQWQQQKSQSTPPPAGKTSRPRSSASLI